MTARPARLSVRRCGRNSPRVNLARDDSGGDVPSEWPSVLVAATGCEPYLRERVCSSEPDGIDEAHDLCEGANDSKRGECHVEKTDCFRRRNGGPTRLYGAE